uniref:Uncharacterized protein n=1 Tax=Oryza glaberrima TaxID=4538 RepID=I1R0F9_ORYGL
MSRQPAASCRCSGQEFVRTVGVTYQEKLATARAAMSQCARSPKLNRPGDGEAVEGAHSELLARQEPMSPAVKLASGGWQSSVTSTPEPSSSRLPNGEIYGRNKLILSPPSIWRVLNASLNLKTRCQWVIPDTDNSHRCSHLERGIITELVLAASGPED